MTYNNPKGTCKGMSTESLQIHSVVLILTSHHRTCTCTCTCYLYVKIKGEAPGEFTFSGFARMLQQD